MVFVRQLNASAFDMSIVNNHTVLNFENTKIYVFIPVLVAKSISLHLKEGRSLMEHEIVRIKKN